MMFLMLYYNVEKKRKKTIHEIVESHLNET